MPVQHAVPNARDLVDRVVPGGPPDEAFRAFEALFTITASELGALIGERGAYAVLQRALTLTRTHDPFLEPVEIRSAGLSLAGLRSSPEDLARSRQSLRQLYVVFADVACSLIGVGLVFSILGRVNEAMKRE
jgi:hypothetical protein